MKERPAVMRRCFDAIMKYLADRTFFTPQLLKVYDINEVETGFRLLQSGKFFGKMMIEMKGQSLVQVGIMLQTFLGND